MAFTKNRHRQLTRPNQATPQLPNYEEFFLPFSLLKLVCLLIGSLVSAALCVLSRWSVPYSNGLRGSSSCVCMCLCVCKCRCVLSLKRTDVIGKTGKNFPMLVSLALPQELRPGNGMDELKVVLVNCARVKLLFKLLQFALIRR